MAEAPPRSAPTAAAAKRGRGALLGLVGSGLLALAVLAAMAAAVRRTAAGPQVGEPAPSWRLQTFDGTSIASRDLAGQVVVLNFWASWCIPCADEADDLEDLWRRFRDRGVQFIGVAYVDTEGAARAYLATHGVSYPNGPDLGGRISRAFRVAGVPETFVIDRAGRIVSLAAPGAEPVDRLQAPLTTTAAFTPDHLDALLERLVADAGPAGSADGGLGGARAARRTWLRP